MLISFLKSQQMAPLWDQQSSSAPLISCWWTEGGFKMIHRVLIVRKCVYARTPHTTQEHTFQKVQWLTDITQSCFVQTRINIIYFLFFLKKRLLTYFFLKRIINSHLVWVFLLCIFITLSHYQMRCVGVKLDQHCLPTGNVVKSVNYYALFIAGVRLPESIWC